MKKIIVILVAFFSFFVFSQEALAQDTSPGINLYLFYRDDCPHCHDEQDFLEKLSEENTNINIIQNEVIKSKEGRDLYVKTVQDLGIDRTGVPLLVIGREYIVGFKNEETTGKKIIEMIERYSAGNCAGEVDYLNQNKEETCSEQEVCEENKGCELGLVEEKNEDTVLENIPFLGEVNLKSFSLPVLTFLVAATDGFNPCAMWVLLFLISLLLGMKDRKRMWLLGGIFILTSGFVYFLFLAAWLELVMFMGAIIWVQITIALVALISGTYHLYDWWKNKDGVCKVTDNEKRKKVFSRIREIIKRERLALAIIGIIILAFAVNLVELVCSIGLPAVYTQVLASASLASWQYYAYLVFYVVIFMLDDMIIFSIAMKTLELRGISSKYSRYANLVGGIVIFILGIYLSLKVIRPELFL